MATTKKIEQRTLQFIAEVERLKKASKLPDYETLKNILGLKSKSTISEIIAKRQNIQPETWLKFKKHFKISGSDNSVHSGHGESNDGEEQNNNAPIPFTDKLLENELGEMKERLLRAEAMLEVYENAIAELMSEKKGDFSRKVGELREEVSKASTRRLAELRKKLS